jgi:hypothetical protein
MSGLPLRRAVDSGRLLNIAFVIAFLEVALRLGLGIAVHPFLYLLTPPVVAIVGGGLLAPGIRTRVLDERRRYAVDDPDGVLLRLLVVAVVGHAFAVVFGLCLFVVLDTPLQAALYWLGMESRQPFLALAWPVIGLLTGTAIAWTLPALVAAGVSEGLGFGRAIRCALSATRRRAILPVLSVNLLGVIGILFAVTFGAFVGFVAASGQLFFALAGGLTVLLATPPLAIAIFTDIETVRTLVGDEQTGAAAANPGGSSSGVSVGRVAVIALLVVSLATLAGAVRMAELRPMDSPDPLGDDPDEMYATALENTLSGSYTAEWVESPGTDEETAVIWQVDREDRQLYTEPAPGIAYISTGTQTIGADSRVSDALRWVLADDAGAVTNGGAHTPPNYFRWADDPTKLVLADPPTEASGWEHVETDGSEVTLALTDERAVLGFAAPEFDPERVESVDESEVRAVIDTESRTLTALDIRYDADFLPEGRLSVTEQYTFEYGTDLDRPDELGSPAFDEYVWRLLLY